MTDALDFRTLPPGDVLDRLVAEARGYEVSSALGSNEWRVLEPGKYQAHFYTVDAETWDEAWRSAIEARFIPAFSTDDIAALTLLPPPPADVVLARYENEDHWTVNVGLNQPRYEDVWFGNGETIALACCRAFLDHCEKAKAKTATD